MKLRVVACQISAEQSARNWYQARQLSRVLAGVGIEALSKDDGKQIGEMLTLADSVGEEMQHGA